MKQQERKQEPDLVLHKPLNEPVERTSLPPQPVSATADADAHARARTDIAALNIRCIRLVLGSGSNHVQVTDGKKQLLVRPLQD